MNGVLEIRRRVDRLSGAHYGVAVADAKALCSEIDRLHAELDRLTRERDDAVWKWNNLARRYRQLTQALARFTESDIRDNPAGIYRMLQRMEVKG
jgi:hypothetical protein